MEPVDPYNTEKAAFRFRVNRVGVQGLGFRVADLTIVPNRLMRVSRAYTAVVLVLVLLLTDAVTCHETSTLTRAGLSLSSSSGSVVLWDRA